ncbi:MAG: cyclic nucleotide-binding domain-containing protein [Gammaproteobacteria bacterium]|nr:cyclic nucleotide-binding domain-containing protein [Gammaproteobacteria bacterium]
MNEEIVLQAEAKRFGDYLIVSPGTLQNAVKRQGQALKQGLTPRHIGELLVENGDITQEEHDNALKRQRIDRLACSPVFSMLSKTELAAISSRFKEITVPAGRQFIIQDEPDPTLYIIASGKVEVYRTNLDGSHLHIAHVEPYEPIGEMGYFQGGVRTASVRAVDNVECLCAEYSALTHYFENVPRVAHAFMDIVQFRQQQMEELIKEQNS